MKTEWIIFLLSVLSHLMVSAGVALSFYLLSQSHEQRMKAHLENHHLTMDYELQDIKNKLERVMHDTTIDRN